MTRRVFAVTAAMLAAAAGLAAAQRPQGGAPPAAQQPGQQPPAGRQPPAEGPKPYRDVITAQATTDSGVFIVHRIAEKLFYEIPSGMFGREFP